MASFPCVMDRASHNRTAGIIRAAKERMRGRQDEASLCNPVMETTFRQSVFLQVPRPSSPEDRVQRDECPVVGTAGDTVAVSRGALHFEAWERDIMLNPQNASGSDALVRASSAEKMCERGECLQHRCEEKPPSWPKEEKASWMVLRESRVPQTARAGVCPLGDVGGNTGGRPFTVRCTVGSRFFTCQV